MESEQPQNRQTQSFLRNLFQERRLKPKNKLGQNFLVDINLIDFLVREAEITPKDLVLEVGSGTGSMTAKLCDVAGAVLSVEIDSDFHELVHDTVGFRPNLRLLHSDILRNKNHLHPKVLEQLHAGLEKFKPEKFKLVANLPYVVATPVIANFLISDFPVERMVVTVQWELAERMIAKPSTKDYGSLAVLVQSLAEVEILRKLAPGVFWPRPKVESAIIRIRPSAAKRAIIGDVQRFRHFLRDLYAHRRKNLRGALLSVPGSGHDKTHIDARLAELGIPGTVRAEDLDLKQHRRLCEVFGGAASENEETERDEV